MERIPVRTAASTYDVIVESGCLERAAEYVAPVVGGRRLFEPNGTPMIELNITQVSHSPDVIHLGFEPVR